MLTELPDWFSVDEDDLLDGFDTRVCFADEIHSFCDPADDGLEVVLGEQPGITAVYAEDREVVYLATRLHLDDVAAAVIRAVVDVNRRPRPVAPSLGEVTDEQALAVADAVASLITAAGYTRRDDGRYFYRDCGHGIVQVLSVFRGLGELTDGTSLRNKIDIHYGVCLPRHSVADAGRPGEGAAGTRNAGLVGVHVPRPRRGHGGVARDRVAVAGGHRRTGRSCRLGRGRSRADLPARASTTARPAVHRMGAPNRGSSDPGPLGPEVAVAGARQ